MQTTYTVYDSEDSSWYRNGLSLQEATELSNDRDNDRPRLYGASPLSTEEI